MSIKKTALLLLAVLLCLSVLAACKDGGGEEATPNFYTVTFETAGGTEIAPKTVKEGNTVMKPQDPEKNGYVFGGWFNGGISWSFDSKVTENITLTAKWITPENYYGYETGEDGNATLTKLKNKTENIILPTTIGGYTVTAVGERLFEDISSDEVASIVIPETVTHIGNRAFAGCEGIKITVEGGLLSVGEKAFLNCDGLSAVTLKEGIETVSAEAFKGAGLKSIIIPESVKLIDDSAFESCKGMNAIIAHEKIEAVNDSAFDGTAIAAVYFYGTENGVDSLLDSRVYGKNDVLDKAKIYLYSETEPQTDTKFEGFWYFDDNGKTKLWK